MLIAKVPSSAYIASRRRMEHDEKQPETRLYAFGWAAVDAAAPHIAAAALEEAAEAWHGDSEFSRFLLDRANQIWRPANPESDSQ